MAGVSYFILARLLVRLHGQGSTLARAIGSDLKGRISIVAYLAAIGGSFVHSWIAMGLYVAVAVLWLMPDRRIERALQE